MYAKVIFAKVIAALAAVGLSIGAVGAADFTWTGNAGDNDWSNGANWGGTAPGDTDTAIFPIAATVTPPTTFTGLMRVNGSGCLTVNIQSEMRFSLAMGTIDFVDTGASFRKTGVGLLTLQAHGGINPGTVTIAEGSVAFAGNGLEPSGAFDRVVLENGVTASVVESPIATRHAYAYRIAQGTDIDHTGMQGYDVKTIVRDFDEWHFVPESATRYFGNQVVGDDATAFDVGSFPYDAYKPFENKSGVMVYYRGLFISEASEKLRWYVTQTVGNGASLRIGFNQRAVCGYWKKPSDGAIEFWPTPTTVERGWAALTYMSGNDLRYWAPTWYIGYAFNLTHTPAYEGDTGRFTGSKLWNGVCFTALEIKNGASLTIADGQAMAIANARAFKMNGSFTGASAATYLCLASDWSEEEGDEKLSAAALRNFPGTVDVAPTAKLGGDDSTVEVPYTIVGRGEVTVTEANKNRLSPEFSGSIVVQKGVSYDLPLGTETIELSDKASVLPVTDSTWQLNSNASFINGGTAIEILSNREMEGKHRASIIAKEGIPVYCPFELSCDIYMPNFWVFKNDYWDLNYGLFVQAEGPNLTYNSNMWTGRAGYMLPASKLCFGVYETGYDGCSLCWVTNELSKVSDPNNNTGKYSGNDTGKDSWKFADKLPMHWKLSYDGYGTFTASVQTDANGGVLRTTYSYPQLMDKKYAEVKLYPSILARSHPDVIARWNYQPPVVSNVAFKVQSVPSVIGRQLTVENGGTLCVKAGQVDAASGTAAKTFSRLTMGEGATVSFAPYFSTLSTGVGVNGVTVMGDAAIVPAANEDVTTTVGEFSSRNGGTLTVSGKVAISEPLHVKVSRSELKKFKGDVTLLDASAATPVPAIDLANVDLQDIDGSGKRIELSYVDGLLRACANMGLIISVE